MIRLNEVGLAAFFRGPQMERILEPRAEAVRLQALSNANNDIIGIWTGRLYEGVFARVEQGDDSLQAVVGTTAKDANGVSYPAYWDKEGGKPWLTGALETYFPEMKRRS